MPTSTSVSETSPVDDWRYTAEGGANLVLRWQGDPASLFQGKAIRLRKRPLQAADQDRPADEVDPEAFQAAVIRPLLGGDLCLRAQPVPLERKWLEAAADALRKRRDRPPARAREDDLDLGAPHGTLVDDLVSGPPGQGSLTVEIKPKWGFLPAIRYLSPATARAKTTSCRTCMHRHYKRLRKAAERATASRADEGHVLDSSAETDQFCPLDLYSQDPERIGKALRQLYRTWNASEGTTNNLRLFLNGELLKPSEQTDLAGLEAALIASTGPASSATATDPASAFARLLLPILLRSPVLPRLKHLQSSLDPLDIEGLALRLRTEFGIDVYAMPGGEKEGGVAADRDKQLAERLGGQPSVEEWAGWLEGWRARSSPELTAAGSASSAEAAPAPAAAQPGPVGGTISQEPRDLVLAYLLSATFKDCSIFIRLPFPPPPAATSSMAPYISSPTASPHTDADATLDKQANAAASARDPEGVQIRVIDLDPKPLARLGKYARLDREIWTAAGALDSEDDAEEEEERERAGVVGRGRRRRCWH
ncbi:hypothetical protein JCM8202_003101 [Rhodotorula sphaerocarpa]